MTPSQYNDSYHDMLKYHLDIFFQRLPPVDPEPGLQTGGKSWLKFIQDSAKAILGKSTDRDIAQEQNVPALTIEPSKALPRWLIQDAKFRCKDNPEKLEDCIWDVLSDPIQRRKAVDHIIMENELFILRGSDAARRTEWMEKRLLDIKDNRMDKIISSMSCVEKFQNSFITNHMFQQSGKAEILIEMLGTLTFMNFGTPVIYNNALEFLKTKYRKTTIIDAFKKIFHTLHDENQYFEWVVLVVGNISKLFSVRDFLKETAFDLQSYADDGEVTFENMTMAFLSMFDQGTDPQFYWARFRLAKSPSQEFLNRLGAAYWLKKTLDSIKKEQVQVQPKSTSQDMSTVDANPAMFKLAMSQKSWVTLRLIADQNELVSCLGQFSDIQDKGLGITAKQDLTAWVGKNVRVEFAVTSSKNRKTYVQLESVMAGASLTSAGHWEAFVKMPQVMSVKRRASQRVGLVPGTVTFLDLSPFQSQVKPGEAQTEAQPPSAMVCLPAMAEHFRVVDISVNGMSFEVRQGAHDLGQLLKPNQELVVNMGLSESSESILSLMLKSVVRSVTVAPDGTRYIGLQFLAEGKARQTGEVRWQNLSSNGVWAIGDWIFKQTRADSGKGKPAGR